MDITFLMENVRQLANEISEDYETWTDFEIAIEKYTAKFSLEVGECI